MITIIMDLQIVEYLAAQRTPLGVAFFSFITNFGGIIIVVPVVLIACLVLVRGRRWPYAAGLLFSIASSWSISAYVKELMMRPRPPAALQAIPTIDYSFPSEHAASAMAIYGYLAIILWHLPMRRSVRYAGAGALISLVALVALSRVYLGIHYPSDVLAGLAFGSAGAFAASLIARALARLDAALTRRAPMRTPRA